MQYLITGVPGVGKTQRAFWRVLNDERFKKRPVYYHNCGELDKTDPRIANWQELTDFTQWHKLPPGSVLIVDECQSEGILPIRPASSKPPEHIEAFSKSRKLGIDVILVTQHPKNMDLFVRRMMETHEHLTRVGQFEYATVTEYREYQDVDSKPDESTVISRTRWPYDKSIWRLYKSAELHTVKKKVPKVFYRFVFLVVLTLVLIAAGVYIVYRMGTKQQANAKTGTAATAVAANDPFAAVKEFAEAVQTFKQSLVPLDAAYPESATIYDDVRKPLTFPRLTGCVSMQGKCKCFTQQATPVPVDEGTCQAFITVGRFDPYRDDRIEREREQRTVEHQRRLALVAAADSSHASQPANAPGVASPPPIEVPKTEPARVIAPVERGGFK